MSHIEKEQFLFSLYSKDIPSFLEGFLPAPSLERIKHVGMHCGMEYTSFPFYKDFEPYSRFVHSLGVALIVYHFRKNQKESLSGLFHDIATPAFAHVVDFVKGDYLTQEATEERTTCIIEEDPVIQKELMKLGLSTKDVDNYHLYPIADNDSPRLSADRLEYTLSNFLNYSHASREEVEAMYRDLSVTVNEDGVEELAFSSKELARKFALATIQNSKVYVTPEDRYGMEALARGIRRAFSLSVLSENDLYSTEEVVIKKFLGNQETKNNWEWFTNLTEVKEHKTEKEHTIKVYSKRRYIDPLVIGRGRIKDLDPEVEAAIDAFRKESFDSYLEGISKAPGKLPDRD